ncbi:MAG TPA: hypothetical protein VFC07_08725, partial [Verrucomicrobiae bacterium]|nr:hypothetical protein [Verrucomicrobiae bacterium]
SGLKNMLPVMDSTPDAKAGGVAPRSRAFIIAIRVALILFVGWLVGNATSWLETYTSHLPGRSGFGRGILHGILMPFSMPNLLAGQNVSIYNLDNTGRTYNLGFTLGVNSCGLVFFGYFFWRVKNLRKMLKRTA